MEVNKTITSLSKNLVNTIKQFGNSVVQSFYRLFQAYEVDKHCPPFWDYHVHRIPFITTPSLPYQRNKKDETKTEEEAHVYNFLP